MLCIITSQQPREVGLTVSITEIQTGIQESEHMTPGHTARKEQTGLKPGLTPKTMVLQLNKD